MSYSVFNEKALSYFILILTGFWAIKLGVEVLQMALRQKKSDLILDHSG